jgi:serine/threonine-protein kinase
MPADAAQAIAIGQSFGRYRVEGLLGSGGMGKVYLAQDCALGRTVAIKVVDHSRHDPDALRLLVREARLAASLSHPSICSVHEVGQVGDEPFIVMEHVKGEPLSTAIHRRRALPFETALNYEMQIVDAVAHAHDHAVVHGDIKSSNIMVGPGGRIKILDFGLAVQRAAREVSEISRLETTTPPPPSSCTGTVPYMAPELLRGRPADIHTDIWALGVVFYEMLVGYRPFRGATAYELAAAILANEPISLPSWVPTAVRQVVERCLVTCPAGRYPSARDLASDLDDLR